MLYRSMFNRVFEIWKKKFDGEIASERKCGQSRLENTRVYQFANVLLLSSTSSITKRSTRIDEIQGGPKKADTLTSAKQT